MLYNSTTKINNFRIDYKQREVCDIYTTVGQAWRTYKAWGRLWV